MGAAPVIPHAQLSFCIPVERDEGAISIAKRSSLAGDQGIDRAIKAANLQQRFLQLPMFPRFLAGILEMLEGASPTVVGQDARRSSGVGGRQERLCTPGKPLGALPLLQLHPSHFPRQQERHHNHPVLPARDAIAAQVKIFSGDGDYQSWNGIGVDSCHCKGVTPKPPRAVSGLETTKLFSACQPS